MSIFNARLPLRVLIYFYLFVELFRIIEGIVVPGGTSVPFSSKTEPGRDTTIPSILRGIIIIYLDFLLF